MRLKSMISVLVVSLFTSSTAQAGDLTALFGVVGGVLGATSCKNRDSNGDCILKTIGGAAIGAVAGMVLEKALDKKDRKVYYGSYAEARHMHRPVHWKGRRAYGQTEWVDSGYYVTQTHVYEECRRYVITYWTQGRRYTEERAQCVSRRTQETVYVQNPHSDGFYWGTSYDDRYTRHDSHGLIDPGLNPDSPVFACDDREMDYNAYTGLCETDRYRSKRACMRSGGVDFDWNTRICSFEP